MRKFEIYKSIFSLFLDNNVPDEVLKEYVQDVHGDISMEVQDFIVNNMKSEIKNWCTGIGIMDAADLLYHEAISNGNIK